MLNSLKTRPFQWPDTIYSHEIVYIQEKKVQILFLHTTYHYFKLSLTVTDPKYQPYGQLFIQDVMHTDVVFQSSFVEGGGCSGGFNQRGHMLFVGM